MAVLCHAGELHVGRAVRGLLRFARVEGQLIHERRTLMTHTGQPENAGALEADISQVRSRLAQMTKILEALEAQVMEGDSIAIRESVKVLSDMRTWARLAIETEARFAERDKQQRGAGDGYALHLREARAEIGCRLARLRRSCGAGKVSE